MPGYWPGSKLIILLAGLLALLASACNLRENALLPPGLDPKEYVIESTIRVYSDHLIRSTNDDSYLYIPKESITDAGLWYGDVLTLSKEDDLTQRDSLAFATGTIARTDTYSITINRAGTDILLDSIPNFATLYTDLKGSGSFASTQYTQSGWRLSASDTEVYPYGTKRCFFHIDGNGETALLDMKGFTSLSLEPTGKDIQSLIVTATDYVYTWFPAAYMSDTASLSLQESLSPSEATAVANVFPGFALNTKVLNLQTTNSSPAVPIVRYRVPASKSFGTQWIRLNGSTVNTWPAGAETWVQEAGELISFLKGTGKYFLATPMQDQNSIELPMDGSFSQLYLPGIWLDMRSLNIPQTSLRLDLSPYTQQLRTDYFSGKPFTLAATSEAYSLEFIQNGSVIQELPNEQWIEFGFQTTAPDPQSAKLFSAYRSASKDRVTFKQYAPSYDADHFSHTNSWIYAGYSGSGTYLFGAASESSSTTLIPCLKADTWIHTAKADYSWQDSSLACTQVTIAHGAPISEAHPWLAGEPFSITAAKSICKISAQSREKTDAELPEGFFVSYASSASLQNVVNFSPNAAYPKLAWYRAANGFAHNTFVYDSGRMQISPAWTGYLIDGARISHPDGAWDLRLYSRMLFDNYSWEVLLDDDSAMPAGTLLRMTPRAAFTDNYGVFDAQYVISPLAPIFDYKVLNNSDFYANFSPYIRLRQNSRTENLLFSVSEGEYYRVYTYDQGESANGWTFAMADGHASFYLLYDAEYGVVHDDAAHTIATAKTRRTVVIIAPMNFSPPH